MLFSIGRTVLSGRYGLRGLLLVTSLLCLLGCGPQNESVVRGTVTYQGKKLTGGSVLFNPVDETQPSAHAAIGPDGTYEIRAVTGENKIVINWYSEVDPRLEPGDPGYAIPRALIPEKYSRIDSTPLIRTVEPKETVIDFDLD
ncbi:hypothetical protein AB1L30_13565 [Bremerella sp. JC817]|uniref:hypothetical protein n=1 Tax=Bremerella sp. JC817 TaxID=3231756 RepID=UPI003458909D